MAISANILNRDNSTSTTLAASGVFTGAPIDLLSLGGTGLRIMVKSDVNSATDGLSFQFTDDPSAEANWEWIEPWTYLAPDAHAHVLPMKTRYFRVKYTNGASNQTHFRLQTLVTTTPTVHRSRWIPHVLADATITGNNEQIFTSLSHPLGRFAIFAEKIGTGGSGTLDMRTGWLSQIGQTRRGIYGSQAASISTTGSVTWSSVSPYRGGIIVFQWGGPDRPAGVVISHEFSTTVEVREINTGTWPMRVTMFGI